MPIYEYECQKCGYIFEEVHSIKEPSKVTSLCPICKEKDQTSIGKRILSKTSSIVNGYNVRNGYSMPK